MTSQRPSVGVGYLALLGATIGLVVGTLESIGVLILLAVPGGLSWNTANGPDVMYVAPIVNAVVFGGLGAIFGLLAFLNRRLRWDVAFALAAGLLAGYLGATMPGPFLAWWAIAIVALGVGVVARRAYLAHGDRLRPRLPLIAMTLLAVSAAALPVLAISRSLIERGAYRKLPAIAASSPNLLLLVIDTQRADHLGLYGYDRPTSPNLDRLGANGLVFDRAIAHSSWTLPSHATMLTGRFLHEHRAGVLRRPYLDGDLPTVTEALQRAGYATGGFVANTFWTGSATGIDRGFIRFQDYYQNIADAIARTTVGRLAFYTLLPKVGLIDTPGRRRVGEMNDELLGWIDGLGGRPFFAFVNYFDVHGPLQPPKPFLGTFGPVPSQDKSDGVNIGALTDRMQVPPPAQLQIYRDRYDESILSFDAGFGELMTALESRGLRENTLVIVTSDHGEGFGEHDLMWHGHSLYQDQVDIPLILSWPAGLRSPGRRGEPVGLERLPATLLAAAGLPTDPFPAPSLLAPAGPDSGSAEILIEVSRRSMVPLGWPSSKGWVAGLITPAWRYLEMEDGTSELYDAVNDRRELSNLAPAPDRRAALDSLKARLARYRVREGLD